MEQLDPRSRNCRQHMGSEERKIGIRALLCFFLTKEGVAEEIAVESMLMNQDKLDILPNWIWQEFNISHEGFYPFTSIQISEARSLGSFLTRRKL